MGVVDDGLNANLPAAAELNKQGYEVGQDGSVEPAVTTQRSLWLRKRAGQRRCHVHAHSFLNWR